MISEHQLKTPYVRYFKEAKNIGSFLNGTQTANKAVNVIKKLLINNGMSIRTRLGKSGWSVYWNGYDIHIQFSMIYKKNKKGFNTDIPEKGQMEQYEKGFKLIKAVYPSVVKNNTYHRFEIKSE